MNKLQRASVIGIGALVLSTLAIQASDVFRGIEGNLAGLVSESTSVCGANATQILLGSHSICVDIYEASASSNCVHANPQSSVETQENANDTDCLATTEVNAIPWRFISLTQAQQLCARSGKRLPTGTEWYAIVSGFVDDGSCNTDSGSGPAKTGSTNCSTAAGVHDMIGNVWEWVNEEIVGGTYNDRVLPESGYVSLVDTNGVVVETSNNGSEEFGNDYAWTNSQGIRGMIRGGFYGSKDDAGIFAQNLSVPLDFRSTGVGFRCVKDV